MPGRHGGHGRLGQVVVAGADDAAAAQDAGRGGAGRGARRAGAGAGLPQPLGIPGEASQRRRLQVQGAVDEVLGRPERHRGWGVGERVPGGRRRRAVQGLLQGAGVRGSARLDLWRRRLPRRNCWRIVVRLGTSLSTGSILIHLFSWRKWRRVLRLITQFREAPPGAEESLRLRQVHGSEDAVVTIGTVEINV